MGATAATTHGQCCGAFPSAGFGAPALGRRRVRNRSQLFKRAPDLLLLARPMQGFDEHLAALRAERERLERESGLPAFVPRSVGEEDMRFSVPRPTLPPPKEPPPLPSMHSSESEILGSIALLKEEHARNVRRITELSLSASGATKDFMSRDYLTGARMSASAPLGVEGWGAGASGSHRFDELSAFSSPALAAALAGGRMATDLTSLTRSFGAASHRAPASAPSGWTANYRSAGGGPVAAPAAERQPARPSFDRPLAPPGATAAASTSAELAPAPAVGPPAAAPPHAAPPTAYGGGAPRARTRSSPARAPSRPRGGEPAPTPADFKTIGPVLSLSQPADLSAQDGRRPSRPPSARLSTSRTERPRSASVGRARPPPTHRSSTSVYSERQLRASADAPARPSSARLPRSGSAPSLRPGVKKDPPPFGYYRSGIALHLQPRAETLHDQVQPRTYVARPIPDYVKERRWEVMQEAERQRKARVREEAKRLAAKARLPPRMEERAKTDAVRAAAEAEKAAAAEAAEAARQKENIRRAKPVPADVRLPKWEAMQLEEAGRSERVHAEAQKLAARSRLPPRMQQEADSRTREMRKQADLERVRAEAHKDETFTPLVRPLPSHSHPFKPAPRPFNPPPPRPFDLLTDAIKDPEGKGTIPSNSEKERVLRDMARDELVLPERRWPYVSTRAPVRSTPPPPVQPVPPPPTTTSAELRKAALEMEKLKRQIEQERKRQGEERRLQDVAAASKKVAQALDLPSAREKERRERREQAERARLFRKELEEKDAAHRATLDEMYARVAQRPFLFQQQGIDQRVYEETQAAYEKFESALKRQGLGELLDVQ
jgi:hypothetical protein